MVVFFGVMTAGCSQTDPLVHSNNTQGEQTVDTHGVGSDNVETGNGSSDTQTAPVNETERRSDEVLSTDNSNTSAGESDTPGVDTQTDIWGTDSAVGTESNTAESNTDLSSDTWTFVESGTETDTADEGVISLSTDAQLDGGLEQCVDGMCPDDDDFCNGREICDLETHTCIHVNPLSCNNSRVCDGEERCDPLLGCVKGDKIECSQNQVCSEPSGTCVCAEGYTGDACDKCDESKNYVEWPAGSGQCLLDMCNPDPCHGHGACGLTGLYSFECDCVGNWKGDTCAFMWEAYGSPNRIKDFAIDESDRIWAISYAGLFVLDVAGTPTDPSDDRFTLFDLGDTLPTPTPNSVTVDGDAVWITFNSQADSVLLLLHQGTPFDTGDDQQVMFPTVDGLGQNRINDVVVAHQEGGYWFLTDGPDSGVSYLNTNKTLGDKTDDTWTRYAVEDGIEPMSPLGFGFLMAMDSSGGKWLGHSASNSTHIAYWDDNGTPEIKGDDAWLLYYYDYDDDSYVSTHHVYVDGKGEPWFSMNEGILYLDTGGTPLDNTDDTPLLLTEDDGLSYNGVMDMVEDGRGGMWILAGDNTLNYLNRNDTVSRNDDDWMAYPLSSSVYKRVAVDSHNGKWLSSSHDDGFLYFNDSGTPLNPDDDEWYTLLAPESFGPMENNVEYVMADKENNGFWVLISPHIQYFEDGGTPFDKSDDTWHRITGYETLLQDDDSPWLKKLAVAPDNKKWIVVSGMGVLCFDDNYSPIDQGDDRWSLFTEADGLVSWDVKDVVFDEDGSPWFVTSTGVSYLNNNGTVSDKSDDAWVTFTEDDGLYTNDLLSIAVSEDGIKWFGGNAVSHNLTYTNEGGITALNDNGTPLDKSDDMLTVFLVEDGLTHENIADVLADGWGGIWTRETLLVYGGTPSDKTDDAWHMLPQVDDPSAVDEKGGVWSMGPYDLNYFHHNYTPSDRTDDTLDRLGEEDFDVEAFDIELDGRGGGWILSNKGLYYMYREPEQ